MSNSVFSRTNPGDQIGPYLIVSKLGEGGFGEVWLAEKRSKLITMRYAIKLPLASVIDYDAAMHEAALWQQASGHPNILPIVDADEYDGQIVIVSEYAPNGSLGDHLKANNIAPSAEIAVEIVSGILRGLDHLHSRGIIHRDLKPANILFQGKTPRLADFGISRVLKSTVKTEMIAGTREYMAPEVFDGIISKQADIWAAGIILYRLVAGYLPFTHEYPSALIKSIVMSDPRALPPGIPNDLQYVLKTALAKELRMRYKSAADMLNDLQRAAHGEPPLPPPKPVPLVPPKKDTVPPIRPFVDPETGKDNPGSTLFDPQETGDLPATYNPDYPKTINEPEQETTQISAPVKKDQTLALVSLVLGILSMVLCASFITGPIGLITGNIARKKAIQEPLIYQGRGLAATGMILSSIGTLIGVLLIIFYLYAILTNAKF